MLNEHESVSRPVTFIVCVIHPDVFAPICTHSPKLHPHHFSPKVPKMKLIYRPQQLLEWRHERQKDREAFSEIYKCVGPIRLALRFPVYQKGFRSDGTTLPLKQNKRNFQSGGLLLFSVSDLPLGTRIIRVMPGEKVPPNAIPIVVDQNSLKAISSPKTNFAVSEKKPSRGNSFLFQSQTSYGPEKYNHYVPQMYTSHWWAGAWHDHGPKEKNFPHNNDNLVRNEWKNFQNYFPNGSVDFGDIGSNGYGRVNSPYQQMHMIPSGTKAGTYNFNFNITSGQLKYESGGAFGKAAPRFNATTQEEEQLAECAFEYDFKYVPFFERYLPSSVDQCPQMELARPSDSASSCSSCDVQIQVPAFSEFSKR